MSKLAITGKELRALGYPEGPVISIAISTMAKHHKHTARDLAISMLSEVLADPPAFKDDAVMGPIAKALIPKPRPENEVDLSEEGIRYNVYGAEGIEEGAQQQMRTAAKLPVAVAGALMPDAHHGYGLPIGGVLATDNAVIPYGVGVDIGCFTGDTRVQLADGRALSLLELIEEDKLGKENFTFSLDSNRAIVISKIRAPRPTRVADSLLEITLDNGEKYLCTPDHIHYRRDGGEVRADALQAGDSLMPLYLTRAAEVPMHERSFRDKRVKLEDYLTVHNPATGLYDYVHFLADEFNLKTGFYDKSAGPIRHHRDFNKYNNNPINIQRVGYKEHFAIHSAHVRETNKLGLTGFKKARQINPEFFARMGSENMKRNHQDPGFAERRDRRAAETFTRYNRTEAFYNMTRSAGRRGKEFLIAKNKSEAGRVRSKEVSQKRYQCPSCGEIGTGGFGTFNHAKKSTGCSIAGGDYKSFKEVRNHRVVSVRSVSCPGTQVYCLTIDEYENFALAAGVFVHNCRMALSIFDINPKELEVRTAYFSREINEATLFGSGATFKRPHDHAVMQREEFGETALLRSLKDRAWKQLGSSGSGNHFVEFGVVEIGEEDKTLGVPAGKYVGLLSHSGSRALGANVASHYTRLAKEKRALPPEAANLAWLSLDEEEGMEYWRAMNLAGDYASANHHIIHEKIAAQLGRQPLRMVENHHNFAWKEKHGGREVIVHRKGATPAGKGVLGVIPGSMTAPGFIVKGKGEEASVSSASHGAGRLMSRTAALQKITQSQLKEELKARGVTLLGGGLDEAPFAYKDIHAVMKGQRNLVDVVGSFQPKIVKMCGDAPKGKRGRGGKGAVEGE